MHGQNHIKFRNIFLSFMSFSSCLRLLPRLSTKYRRKTCLSVTFFTTNPTWAVLAEITSPLFECLDIQSVVLLERASSGSYTYRQLRCCAAQCSLSMCSLLFSQPIAITALTIADCPWSWRRSVYWTVMCCCINCAS